MRRGLLPAILFLLSTSPAPGGQPVADQFVLPDDLEITLWAESPMFFNPTNIDVDARGRVWVAEAVNYRGFNTAKAEPLTHPAGDRIVILSDTDGDGRADSTKVFVQDTDLRAPLGLAVIGNRVIVSASPHLVVYTDENGDDTPDKKEILLTGFGGSRSRSRPSRARRRARTAAGISTPATPARTSSPIAPAGRCAPAASIPAARPTT